MFVASETRLVSELLVLIGYDQLFFIHIVYFILINYSFILFFFHYCKFITDAVYRYCIYQTISDKKLQK